VPKKRVVSTTRPPKGLPYISASSRAAFKRCRYSWHFRYMRKEQPKFTAPALRFGTLYHTAQEHYYKPGIKRGPHPARVFEKAYEQEFGEALALGFKDEDGKWHDALSLGVDMLEHYVEHYGSDDEWRVLATEQVFEEPVLDPATGQVLGIYMGVLDAILEHRPTKKIWIRDYKTAKTIDTRYLAMDDQSSGYWTFGVDWMRRHGIIKPGQNLAGIDFCFARKGKRDTRPQNEDGHYTNKPKKEHYIATLTAKGVELGGKESLVVLEGLAAQHALTVLGDVSEVQPSPHFKRHPSFRGEHERKLTKIRVAQEIKEIEMVKRGELAIGKTPDRHCSFCDVRDICELHEAGADWEEMARLTMVPRERFKRVAIEFEHDH
jgi:hypothetical protein